MELYELTAAAMIKLLRQREVSALEITESILARIAQKEKRVNAFITQTPEIARNQAQRVDEMLRRGDPVPLLAGIPLAVKDNICTRGIPTTCGSRMLQNYIPPYDATVVKRLLGQGMVLVGKTNMDEFAMGSSTETSAFGPVRNPVDPGSVAGGSSGGSAAAVAAGECALALGSDTGGSIRLPAAFCGVVGMKPTYGRVSRYGLVAYASSLDQIGPIGRTVEDTALLLNAVCGHDMRDSTSAPLAVPDFCRMLDEGVHRLRIGLPKEYWVEGLNAEVRNRLDHFLRLLEREGAEMVEVSLPHTPFAVSAYYLLATAEASSNLSRFDGVRYGCRSRGNSPDLQTLINETRSQGFGREVKRRIMLGTYVLSAGYYDDYYLKAQKVRSLIKGDFDSVFEKVDCLVTPVSPCLPFKIGEVTEPLQMYLLDVYTVSLNLAGLPGMSVPCGRAAGLPVGMQIIGKPFDEDTVLRVARNCEYLLAE